MCALARRAFEDEQPAKNGQRRGRPRERPREELSNDAERAHPSVWTEPGATGAGRARPAFVPPTTGRRPRNDGNSWSIESPGQEADSGIAAGSEIGPENALKVETRVPALVRRGRRDPAARLRGGWQMRTRLIARSLDQCGKRLVLVLIDHSLRCGFVAMVTAHLHRTPA